MRNVIYILYIPSGLLSRIALKPHAIQYYTTIIILVLLIIVLWTSESQSDAQYHKQVFNNMHKINY